MKRSIFITLILSLSLLNSSAEAKSGATIKSYHYPEVIIDGEGLGYLKRSEFFAVEASDGTQSHEVYVMADRNQYQQTTLAEGKSNTSLIMTNHNHTAGFSFDGDIEVRVKRLDGGTLQGVEVLPKQKGYEHRVEGDELIISLSEWAYIYVSFPDLEKEPLFIFADPKETDAPSKDDNDVELLTADMSASQIKEIITSTTKRVIYFSEGVYNFDTKTLDDKYSGYQIPMLSNKEYYIPGGAVIVGSFYGDDCENNKMHGRGIVTACGKIRLGSSRAIPYNLYLQGGGGRGNTLEGIHFNCPNHFAVLGRGDLKTRYCKMFGWWHQTDGWGGGDYAVIEDCFIKANDDFIKLYNLEQRVSNVVLYKQVNGAGIQLGWGSYARAHKTIVDGVYVVGDDPKPNGDVSNTAVVNLRTNKGSTMSDVVMRNIYVESDYQRFIGIDLTDGVFKNFTFENIQIEGNNISETNYFVLRDGKGKYSNILFKDLVINGKKITSDDEWGVKQGYSNRDKRITKYKNVVKIEYK